jgi:LDH2 family malate/lactate/ureidoglycolate dehydrogenase
MTASLAAHGRADPPEGWGATVFVQVLDPEAFGGSDGFVREVDWLAAACRASPPRPGGPPVRLPGEGGLRRYREQQAHGVALFAGIVPSLVPWSDKLGVPMPKPV